MNCCILLFHLKRTKHLLLLSMVILTTPSQARPTMIACITMKCSTIITWEKEISSASKYTWFLLYMHPFQSYSSSVLLLQYCLEVLTLHIVSTQMEEKQPHLWIIKYNGINIQFFFIFIYLTFLCHTAQEMMIISNATFKK